MKVVPSVHLLRAIHSMRRIEMPRQTDSLKLHQTERQELLTAWDRLTKTADREIERVNAIK